MCLSVFSRECVVCVHIHANYRGHTARSTRETLLPPCCDYITSFERDECDRSETHHSLSSTPTSRHFRVCSNQSLRSEQQTKRAINESHMVHVIDDVVLSSTLGLLWACSPHLHFVFLPKRNWIFWSVILATRTHSSPSLVLVSHGVCRARLRDRRLAWDTLTCTFAIAMHA